MPYTKEELIALGEKVARNMERDKLRGQASNIATKRLKAAHLAEFEKFLKEEKTKLGI